MLAVEQLERGPELPGGANIKVRLCHAERTALEIEESAVHDVADREGPTVDRQRRQERGCPFDREPFGNWNDGRNTEERLDDAVGTDLSIVRNLDRPRE